MKTFKNLLAESAQGIEHTINDYIERFTPPKHPSIMERYVLRNGVSMHGSPYKGKMGQPKMCFKNATHLAVSQPNLHYVEGYTLIPGLPLLIHHAWCIGPDGKVIDNTIKNPENHEYMGVVISRMELATELTRLKHYGILDTNSGINFKYMFRHDPELKKITEEITGFKFGG